MIGLPLLACMFGFSLGAARWAYFRGYARLAALFAVDAALCAWRAFGALL